MSEQEVYIDVDKVLEAYNKKHPKKPINRVKLVDMLGIHYQNLVNYKMGKVPVVVKSIKKMMEISGLKFNQIVKEK